LESFITFEVADFLSEDFAVAPNATFVYTYGVPRLMGNPKFLAKLSQAMQTKSLSRVISYRFEIPSWTATAFDPKFQLYLYEKKGNAPTQIE
jgi:hypothetical protein